MADISSMTLPNGSTYNVKDEAARSGSGLIEMTKAQYDALSSAEKNDGKVRFITDDNIDMLKDYRTAAAQDVIDASLQSAVADKADASYLCYIITGAASPPTSIQEGSYIILRNSTISGITDGLYTAAQAIPANTMIDATYLTAVSDGGFNSLLSNIKGLTAVRLLSMNKNSEYIGDISQHSARIVGEHIVFISLNFRVIKEVPGSSIMFSGLPNPAYPTAIALASNTNAAYRAILQTDGIIRSDGSIPKDTWYDGSVSYFV